MVDSATEDTRPTEPHPSEPGDAQRSDGRRGIRTVVLSAVTLVVLAGVAVGVLWSSLHPVEGPAITGTISVAPELRGRVSDGDTLFIIARKGPGVPFAVKRIAGAHFPFEYRLGPVDRMMAGTPFNGNLHLSVRLSKSGIAGPGEPGDLEGEYPDQVPVGASGVNIVIARVR